VPPKAVMFPTDAKLINRARARLVRQAKQRSVKLRQSYVRRKVGMTTEGFWGLDRASLEISRWLIASSSVLLLANETPAPNEQDVQDVLMVRIGLQKQDIGAS
jgi:hypothetical protein